ncbi:Gfo/Idh/MocA family protein [Pararhizobium mangrovi]|uniref:Gfo/Idh/MocA family oxidoreductase n=1 Tax=Pararhizobium mangrovi TaxID=2590452 RepID=A0A506U2W7_9HYPH|nr:Gfo/Idh/MocA family oxidoreductase [Pararhizobium mangrovi]TPW28150.1 Gfo/Idh/MocA family oxidoreductase [Pararhizobium mangrovi]
MSTDPTTTIGIGIGIVGLGKIARDEHIPAIAGEAAFQLRALASRSTTLPDVECYETLEAMLAEAADVDAVALCTPPQVRYALAARALTAGKHVLLEKPPGMTLSEVVDLRDMAAGSGCSLFATWHSRFAAGVEPARQWLAERRVRTVRILWKEDVRVWHPGQEWIWEPGGLGVFDPGINALSILTRIMPHAVFLTEAELEVPENRQAPIAANLAFTDRRGADIRAEFDWRQEGPQLWTITVETEEGTLELAEGGSRLAIDGEAVPLSAAGEYPGIYRRFADLVRSGTSDVDVSPQRHVADAFMMGRRIAVAPFTE